LHKVKGKERIPVTNISKTKRDELVLLNSRGRDLLLAGFLTSLIVTAPLAMLLAFSYGGPDRLPHLALSLGLIFLLSLLAGIIIPQERRLILTYRLSSGIPIFSTTSFVVWAAAAFALYRGNPDFLGFRASLTTFFVLPLLVILTLSLLYSLAARRVFIALMHRRSRLDYVTLYYKNTILDKLVPLWESARRYGGRLSIFLVKIAFSTGTEEEEMEILDKARTLCRGKLRGSDETGIFSRDTLWVIFPQTSAEECGIPGRRILENLKNSPQLEAGRKNSGFRLIGSAILEADKTMLEPEDFVAAAAEALNRSSGSASEA